MDLNWLLLAIFLTKQCSSRETQDFSQSPKVTNAVIRARKAAGENIKEVATGQLDHLDIDTRLPNLIPMKSNPLVLPFEKSSKNQKILVRLFDVFKRYLKNTSGDDRIVAQTKKKGKYQKVVPLSVPFPCNVSFGRSSVRPNTADQVRPGDIDVIAAFGDSLTSGTGVGGTYVIHDLVNNRGLTALGGGQGTWREYLTLPNILKEYNPKLTGYATGDTFIYDFRTKHRQLNLAEPAGYIADLPHAARAIHQKMKNNPSIDLQKDWKLISIMIGHMDQCVDLCYWKRPQEGPQQVKKIFKETFDYFMENLPRTIVLLIVNINLPKYLEALNLNEARCHLYHRIACPCVYGSAFSGIQEGYRKLIAETLEMQKTVGDDERYRQKPDFRIVTSPVFDNADVIPKIRGTNLTDVRFIAGDCFHLSQRGQALGARNLWNSLFSPIGKKQAWLYNEEDFYCPTEGKPYLFA